MSDLPTNEEQLLLELINRARADPLGEFDALILDAATMQAVTPEITNAIRFFNTSMTVFHDQLTAYDPVAPVAWNRALAISADTHSALMISEDSQSHNLPGEPSLGDRITLAGYADRLTVAENIYAFANDALFGHAGFYIDWGTTPDGIQSPPGHRDTILNATFTEVGVGMLPDTSPTTSVGPYVITQHFGSRYTYVPQLLGVVTDDLDADGFYDIGEGLGGVTISATGAAGNFSTISWDSGGYQMELPDGSFTITYSGGGLSGTVSRNILISGENVKLDINTDDAIGGDLVVEGTGADETLGGGDGNDQIFGRGGNDTLLGGAGDDTLDGGAGADVIDGGAGRDVVSYESATRSVRVDLQNDAFMYNDAVGDTFVGIEVFQTGGTVDQLRGDASGNEFYTGGLSDRLYGRAGDDLLFGETGADALYGGTGADTMTGGDDAGRRDRYIYFNMVESGVGSGNRDVITDFVAGEDRIEISRFDADLTQGFKQHFSFVADTAFSGAAGELRFEQTGGNTIVQADVTGDGLADFEIELTGLMALTSTDFLI